MSRTKRLLISFLNLAWTRGWLIAAGSCVSATRLHCIPPILAGHDVISCAQTGSIKTAAIALHILHTLSQDPYGPYALALTLMRRHRRPVQRLRCSMGVRSAVIAGGFDKLKQSLALQLRQHISVATPGRFRYHVLRANPPFQLRGAGGSQLPAGRVVRLQDGVCRFLRNLVD
ncbi:hypothetical protein PF005_g7222 [Phytophthora fragariae]|uniref:DEAD/DEAH-box helicase domain-containing protein n=1 Tax=Phytophthora fragariae TaxID=53985 RepID=A0A6A3FEE8_9STRA|nr:hypothetical protein PF003_g39761 [Phytophthora fragariae]KAE8942711.1 hypothetical protein PF009_g7540 [Phytophthora fragariae]KAE9019595.1 hypothetical protein PF011_g5762 [Phytophthora fragariae]KAE9122898.1 hypothetical protein PF007_g7262 [Phytophthora fragariae]KAE9149261.1 hypothetical protein PF006_g6227 [Phytophthora fragariae]